MAGLVHLDFSRGIPAGEIRRQGRNLLNFLESPAINRKYAHLGVGFVIYIQKLFIGAEGKAAWTRPAFTLTKGGSAAVTASFAASTW